MVKEVCEYVKLKECSFNRIIGYGALIRTYVAFLLAKLRFHRIRPEFNGLFEYEEYVTLKGIDDPNEGYALAYYPYIPYLELSF